MTTGYPDFQSYAQWIGGNLLSNVMQVELQPGPNLSAVQVMSNWAAAHVLSNTSASPVVVTATWWTDITATQPVWADSWSVPANANLDVIIPARSPYFTLNLTNPGAGLITGQFGLWGTNLGGGEYRYPVTANRIGASALSIPAGATTLVELPWVQPGLATASIAYNDATGDLEFTVVEFNQAGNVAQRIADFGTLAATTWQTMNVVLSDGPCGVSILNHDGAAAHAISYHLTAGGAR